MISKVKTILDRITANLFSTDFTFICSYDNKYTTDEKTGRVYIQVEYKSKCTKSGLLESWKGRKYYLSEYMTDDEVVKTAYVAFQTAVQHEVMEAFKVDNIVLFNPHVNFEELLTISNKEVRRK